MSLRPALLALALASTGALPMTAHAQSIAHAGAEQVHGTLLSISSTAEASRAPDIATLSTGVITQASDANAAMRANAEQMDGLMAAIRAAGIAERDVQTSGIHLNPQYKYADNQPPTITGYQASNNLSVKVRELSKLGKVLDTFVAKGANSIDGPSFGIDKPEVVYDEARVAAIKQAQARAKLYADSLGLQVRRIISITEAGSRHPQPMPVMRMMAAPAGEYAKDTVVAPGETRLSVTVDVVFELAR